MEKIKLPTGLSDFRKIMELKRPDIMRLQNTIHRHLIIEFISGCASYRREPARN